MFRRGRFLLVVALLAVGLAGTAVPRAAGVGIGDIAPDFQLMDIDGESHVLSSCVTPVLMMFFEHDDATALSLAPQVQMNFYDPRKSLLLFGIETSGCSRTDLSDFQSRTGVLFPLLLNGGSVLSEYGIPQGSFVLVDADGIVRYVGEYDEQALQRAVDEALQDAASTKVTTWGLIRNIYK